MALTPSQAMKNTHNKMLQRYVYNRQTQQDIENAQYLERFFYAIKNRQNITQDSGIDASMIDQIIENIRSFNPNIKPEKLFRHSGGQKFEREFAIVENALGAVVSDLNMSNENISNFMTGKEVQLDKIIKNIDIETLQKLGVKLKERINDFGLTEYYIPGGKSVKIDNIGFMELSLKANATPQMEKIFNIMKEATFTAKNYGSKSTDFLKAFENLTLGKTKISSVLLDILPQINGSQWKHYLRTIALNMNEPSVILHVSHLRQIYELIGLGQRGKNKISQQFNGAKYLIYNDYQTDLIRVKATSEIAKDILNSKIIRHNPFDAYTTEISRDLLKVSSTFDKLRKL